MNKQELIQEIHKREQILKYLEEQRDYLEIAESIIRSEMPDNEEVDVPIIIRDRLGHIRIEE